MEKKEGRRGPTSHSASQETNIICSLKKGTRGTYCTEGKVQLCLEHKFGLVPKRMCVGGGESGSGGTRGKGERNKLKYQPDRRREDSRLQLAQLPVGHFTFFSSKGSFRGADLANPRVRAVCDMLTALYGDPEDSAPCCSCPRMYSTLENPLGDDTCGRIYRLFGDILL